MSARIKATLLGENRVYIMSERGNIWRFSIAADDLPIIEAVAVAAPSWPREIVAEAAALAAAPAEEDGWRPIETAPKDGTWILGWSKCGAVEDCIQVWRCYYEFHEGWFWQNAADTSDLDHQPTHWRPLPPAPEGGER
jgi:Protein of unknown function (DUF551)